MDYAESLAAGALQRVGMGFAQAAPTIIIGLFVAAVFRRMLGPANTKRLFAGEGYQSLIVAWFIGLLLPVCSLGVIPIVREMRRAGLAAGTILAFALSAPLFNPLSILYGLTLSHPWVVLSFAFASLFLVAGVGAAWGKLFPRTEGHEPEDTAVPQGWRRLLAVVLFGCREIASPTLAYLAIGLLGVALLAIVVPFGYLQRSMGFGDPIAPLQMLGVGLPAYVTPLTVMAQLGSMFEHGNSIGAALVLLTLGAGVNLGLIAWVGANYGARATAGWLALFLAVVLAFAYGLERPLHDAKTVELDHTHAFDSYCAPFANAQPSPWGTVVGHLRQEVQPYEWYAIGFLGLMLATGLVLRLVDPKETTEAWLEREPQERSGADRFDFALPNWVVGGAAIVGLVALSIVGCYVYYPPPQVVFDQYITNVKTNVIYEARVGDPELAEKYILVWDDLTRKLEVGATIRGLRLTEEMLATTAKIRDLLDELRHAVEHEHEDHHHDDEHHEDEEHDVETLTLELTEAHNASRRAFGL